MSYKFCPYCGDRFEDTDTWPRICGGCGNTTYQSPDPIVLIVQPVADAVLLIRRNNSPKRGQLCLPGGYVDHREPWRRAASRELEQETGVKVNPWSLRADATVSTGGNQLVICTIAPTLWDGLPPFETPTNEVQERILTTKARTLAWPVHTKLLREFLRNRDTYNPIVFQGWRYDPV